MNDITSTPEHRQPPDLRTFLTIFFKHKKKIAAVHLATVAAATLLAFTLPPSFEAQSTLLVKFGREHTYRPEVTEKAPIVAINQEEAINSEITIVNSHDVIENVIKSVGVDNIYPALAKRYTSDALLDAAVARFKKDLRVEVVKKTNVLQVSFTHNNPQMAAKAANLLVDFYQQRHYQVYNGAEALFLERQLGHFQQQLKMSEDNLREFKHKNQLFSLDEQRELLLKQRSELDRSLKDSHSRVIGMQQRLSTLLSQMKNLDDPKGRYTQSDRDKIIVEAKAQLLNLQLKERGLLDRYPESNPLVANVRNELRMVRDFVQQQEEAIGEKVRKSNSVYTEAEKQSLLTEADLSSELAKENAIRLQVAQANQELNFLDGHERQLESLKRELATHEKNYRNYLDRYEEARISDTLNRQKMANLSVIQAATTPSTPTKPDIPLYLFLGVVIGAIAGLGAALIAEHGDEAITTPEDAEKRLRLPVLATVGVISPLTTSPPPDSPEQPGSEMIVPRGNG